MMRRNNSKHRCENIKTQGVSILFYIGFVYLVFTGSLSCEEQMRNTVTALKMT